MEFLYESGLAVGKSGASEGFKALEAFPKNDDAPSTSSASASLVFFKFHPFIFLISLNIMYVYC